jgi:DNA-binding transcriptional MerR regulator
MRIGELADASGVSPRSLRYYESLGLIRSERTPGGWREFDDSMVERVVMIQHLFAAGLCSATINELLPCLEAPPEERTGVMEQLLLRELERLEAKRREIDRELDTLRVLRDETAVAALRGRAVTEHLGHAETQAQLPVT